MSEVVEGQDENGRPVFTLAELVNLSLATPEIGNVNFKILRILLLSLCNQLGIDNLDVPLDDEDTDAIAKFKAHPVNMGKTQFHPREGGRSRPRPGQTGTRSAPGSARGAPPPPLYQQQGGPQQQMMQPQGGGGQYPGQGGPQGQQGLQGPPGQGQGQQYPPGQGPQQGQYPPGQGPQQGQYPPGQYPPGQGPRGQYPPGQGPQQGQYPPGQGPQGQYPPGQGPQQGQQGQYPPGQYPPGQGPQQGQYPPGQAPGQGQYPPGQYPPGQGPQGQYPPGQGPQQGQYPPGQGPQGQYPPGQYPPGQGPQQGQYPPGQGPQQGQYPPGQGPQQGQYPPGQGPQQGQYPPGQGPQQGQYPPGQGPQQGQYPPGQGPQQGQYPPGQGPQQGQYPPGQGPQQGQYPPGQGPQQGQYPPGQGPQQGQYPPGQYPPGQYPPGQGPQGQYPPGQGPQGQYPPGQGQYPPGQGPQGQQGQYPPGQGPQQGQYPPGQAPGQGQYPPGQYPPGQGPPQQWQQGQAGGGQPQGQGQGQYQQGGPGKRPPTQQQWRQGQGPGQDGASSTAPTTPGGSEVSDQFQGGYDGDVSSGQGQGPGQYPGQGQGQQGTHDIGVGGGQYEYPGQGGGGPQSLQLKRNAKTQTQKAPPIPGQPLSEESGEERKSISDPNFLQALDAQGHPIHRTHTEMVLRPEAGAHQQQQQYPGQGQQGQGQQGQGPGQYDQGRGSGGPQGGYPVKGRPSARQSHHSRTVQQGHGRYPNQLGHQHQPHESRSHHHGAPKVLQHPLMAGLPAPQSEGQGLGQGQDGQMPGLWGAQQQAQGPSGREAEELLLRRDMRSLVLLDLDAIRNNVRLLGGKFDEQDFIERLNTIWEAIKIIKNNEETLAIKILRQDAILKKIPAAILEKLQNMSPESWDAVFGKAGKGAPPTAAAIRAMMQKGQMLLPPGTGGGATTSAGTSGTALFGPGLEKGELQNIYNNLVNIMTQTTEHEDKLAKLEDLLRNMEMGLVTKQMLIDGLNDKADKGMINTKVSYDEFGTAVEELQNALRDLVMAAYNNNEHWKELTDRLSQEVKDKLDKSELIPVKAFFKSNIKALDQKIRRLQRQIEEPDPAGTRRKLLKDYNCISCDKHCNISGVTNGPTIPMLGPILAGHTTASRRAFDLHRMRMKAKFDHNCRDMLVWERQQRALSQLTPDGCWANSEDTLKLPPDVNRYQAGSHTELTNAKLLRSSRTSKQRMASLLAQQAKELAAEEAEFAQEHENDEEEDYNSVLGREEHGQGDGPEEFDEEEEGDDEEEEINFLLEEYGVGGEGQGQDGEEEGQGPGPGQGQGENENEDEGGMQPKKTSKRDSGKKTSLKGTGSKENVPAGGEDALKANEGSGQTQDMVETPAAGGQDGQPDGQVAVEAVVEGGGGNDADI